MDPIEFEPMTDDLTIRIKDSCAPGLMPSASIKVTPSGCCMPAEFADYAERLRCFPVRSDDVWCISYPKCGTTWTQEMIWLLGNNLDFKTAKEKLLLQRVPFLEAISIIEQESFELDAEDQTLFGDTISYTNQLPSPRFIKTHLPVKLLPLEIWTRKPKIIYVTRDPKDVAISYYHHHRLWNGYTGSYEDFIEGFLQDKLVYSPFWEHVAAYKKLSHYPNVLINSYEEMTSNLPNVIKRTAEFLGKPINDNQLQDLVNHLTFRNMKENAAVNGEEFIVELKEKHGMPKDDPELSFIRKGKSGGWKENMSLELIEKFDKWSEQKKKALNL